MNKIPIIAIIGPTAVGKTMFSLELAKNLNAEVISVDSRQVYRYLNVGTDKVDAEIRKEVLLLPSDRSLPRTGPTGTYKP